MQVFWLLSHFTRSQSFLSFLKAFVGTSFKFALKVISMKIVNNQSIRGKESYLNQTEDYRAGDSLSDDSEELLWGSRVFSTVFFLVRTKNIHQTSQGYIPLCLKKK